MIARAAACLIYFAISFCIWPVALFYYFCRVHTDGKYKNNYRQRLGLDSPGQLGGNSSRIWIHALSVGETLSAVPLVQELKSRCPEIEIVFSTATETGMKIARERLSGHVDLFFHMPHDFPWVMRSLLRRIRPAIFVLVETDLWPILLSALKRKRVFTTLVNGRISPQSHVKYLKFRGLTSLLFNSFDLVFTQTEQDVVRFLSLGLPLEKVAAVGNLKYESSLPEVREDGANSLRKQIGLGAGRPVWVAGSTHEGEDEIVLRVHRELLSNFPGLLLIIAPRKIERRADIEALCASSGFSWGVRSKGESTRRKQVYILDTMGELARFYALGHAAFIGGSIVPFGGHNPLEAVARKTPACWGPHMFNFDEIEKALLESGSCRRISCEKEIADFVRKALSIKDRGESGVAPVSGPGRIVAGRIASTLLDKISPT